MEYLNTIPPPVEFDCPKCKKTNIKYLHDQTLNYICPHCYVVIDNLNRTYDFELRKNVRKFYLKLGAIGIVKDVKYMVTGMLNKKSVEDHSIWTEYTLYNPEKGYAWLTVYDGNWTFVEEMSVPPLYKWPYYQKDYSRYINYDNDVYTKFLIYNTLVIAGKGEFHYDLNSVESALTVEYIKPPYLISFTKTENEIMWFKGEYIENDLIRSGFDLDELPRKQSQGYLEEYKDQNRSRTALTLYLITLLIAALYMLVDNSIRDSTKVLNYSEFEVLPIAMDHYKKVGEFKLHQNHQVLEFKFRCAELHNEWAYMDVELLEKKSGKTTYFNMPVEFYSGYDGGESWTEGDNENNAILSNMEKGEYSVGIKAIGSGNTPLTVNLSVEKNIPIFRNFFMLVLVASIVPLYHLYKSRKFEINRWLHSNLNDE